MPYVTASYHTEPDLVEKNHQDSRPDPVSVLLRGDYTGAVLSAGALIPFIGDAAGATKIGRRLASAVDSVSDVAKGVHGNSKLSTAAQHGYEIFETATGNVVKIGVSSGPVTLSGKSYRANNQVSLWNKASPGMYDSRIVKIQPAGPGARANKLEWEKAHAEALRANGQLKDRRKHQRP